MHNCRALKFAVLKCTYQRFAQLELTKAKVEVRWRLVRELTASLPLGSGVLMQTAFVAPHLLHDNCRDLTKNDLTMQIDENYYC